MTQQLQGNIIPVNDPTLKKDPAAQMSELSVNHMTIVK
eukprot:CAMPEP_0183371372 /NCGR_PEP_ID=MMETSP0164_2-20130417/105176_1 /TAXON_ID=221442 /ORGANISM="Coccolithus pelagicus ssp braarudi, Strain PLY182g" /LENGTH=37 /DNA_ID= /DNA_START= /DNA_END= /DNA_ORIENTATION=